MDSVDEAMFRPLAEVAVRVGVNLQPGQRLIVQAPVSQAPAARAISRAAYEAGALRVQMLFVDGLADRIHLEMAPEAGLTEFAQWLADGMEREAREGSAFLSIVGEDPGLLEGVPPERVQAAMRARQAATLPLARLLMAHKAAWSAVAAPSEAWAARVFPDLPPEQAFARLWQAILSASRADGPDPIAAWRAHIADLQARRAWLNELGIASLHYEGPGTDLRIALPPTHQWVASGQSREVGYATSPNIPTEEVFTLPLRDGVDGTVRGTKPVSYNGQVIDGIRLRLEGGRIAEVAASRGEEVLRAIVETDDGSHHLGEVALVPAGSPIDRSGILFYNTLFDENAACHIAIGAAYPTCLTDAHEVQSDADLIARGGNASMVHLDFMVGSDELDITATTRDGRVVPVFRRGRWAQ